MRILRMVLILMSLGIRVLSAQSGSDSLVIVKEVVTEGNRLTRPSIILREVKVKPGDTFRVTEIEDLLEKSRQNVFNTTLFNHVSIDTVHLNSQPDEIRVVVHVIERWYIWPIPYLEFPNRNINAWLADPRFSTLTWGLNLRFNNARGRNETLTLMVHLGFNQLYGFTYQTPYLNKRQTWGIGFGGSYEANRSLIIGDMDNKSVYLSTDSGYLRQQAGGFAELHYRRSIYSYHLLRLSYDYNRFADTIQRIPGYLTDSSAEQSFISLAYKYKLDHRDIRFYPLQGYYVDLEATGFGFFNGAGQMVRLQSTFRKYWKLSGRWFLATGLTAMVSWPEPQPYYIQKGVGYGRDFIRGFEYYSIHGNWFALTRNNVKFALIPPRTEKIRFIRNPKFGVVPFALYLNLFADAGYINQPDPGLSKTNPLVNKFLVGYGFSLDVVTYYDIVIDLNFALNSLGEPGFYIHFIAPI